MVPSRKMDSLEIGMSVFWIKIITALDFSTQPFDPVAKLAQPPNTTLLEDYQNRRIEWNKEY